MTKTVEAQTKQKSDRALAEELLSEYAEFKKQQKEAAKAVKELEEELLVMAEKHTEWFEGKTATLINGDLKWTATSKIDLPEGFELKDLQRKYPNLVEVKTNESIPISKLKVYLEDPKIGPKLTEMGISISVKDRFSVVPLKVK